MVEWYSKTILFKISWDVQLCFFSITDMFDNFKKAIIFF